MNILPEELKLLALQDFQKKYPAVTSGDLQTFVLGYQAAEKDITDFQKVPCDWCKPGAVYSKEKDYPFSYCGNCGRKIIITVGLK